jgi:hypothetical protein
MNSTYLGIRNVPRDILDSSGMRLFHSLEQVLRSGSEDDIVRQAQ